MEEDSDWEQINARMMAYVINDDVIAALLGATPVLEPKNLARSPLQTAVLEGREEDVISLLEAGAEVDAVDANEATALHYAAASDRQQIATKLVKSGARLEAQCIHGATPLHIACLIGGPETVARLLQEGSNVNAIDKLGHSALHYAIFCNYRDKIVQILIDAGAEVNVKNVAGETPLILTFDGRKHVEKEVLDLFRVAKLMRPIKIEDGDIESDLVRTVEVLLKAGADPNAQTENGFTALHNISYYKFPISVMELLLKAGASLELKTSEGDLALHWASHKDFQDWSNYLETVNCDPDECTEQVDLLIQYGADINARNSSNETPLHEACKSDLHGCIVSLLLSHTDEHNLITRTATASDQPTKFLSMSAPTREEFMKIVTQKPSSSSKSYLQLMSASNLIPRQTEYNMLMSDAVRSEFPLFHSHIVRRYAARIALWPKIYGVFARMSPRLPVECVDNICIHFTNKDLELLTKC